MIPFTVNQFLNVFEQYNVAVWPAQLFLYTIGMFLISLVLSRKSDFSRIVSLVLSLFWIWMGIVYHLWFFSTINKAAIVFAAFFVLQGILFFIAEVLKQQLTFSFTSNLYGIVGSVVLVYALVVYPLLGYWLGHRYPATATFGLPCPTTIFTFGMLLWTTPSSSLPISYTTGLGVLRFLGRDLLGNDRGLWVVSGGIDRINANQLPRRIYPAGELETHALANC
jgi:hypothetical protein